MKKIAILMAMLMLVLCLVACGEQTDAPKNTTNAAASQTDDTTAAVAVTEETKAPCNHAFIEAVDKEPSCTECGLVTYTCTLCGESYSEETEPYGHDGTGASCLEPSICSRCFEVVEEAWGHINEDGFCRECGISMEPEVENTQGENIIIEE